MTDLMQVITQVVKERVFGAWAGQEPSIGGQRIQRTKETEALDQFTHERIYRDHPFGFEFAEWHVNGPLMRAARTKAIDRQISAFSNAHTGVAHQQKGIAAKIVAAEEFLLQKLILLGSEWPWESLRGLRDVFATQEMSEFRKLFGPSQFVQEGAQGDEADDEGCRSEWRHLRVQAGHPTEDVGFTAQLLQTLDLGMSRAEIAQKVADGPAVLTNGLIAECDAERIDRVVEQKCQGMLEWRTSQAAHEVVTGRGRMCWATARAYCW
jgi:hypothetical protein